MTAPSQINLYEATLPSAPASGIQALSIDATTGALVKTNSSAATVYLGWTAVANVVLLGKSLGAGTSITSITVAGGVATVTQTAHGYATGDIVVISGATGAGVGDINQLHVITVTGANTYTFVTTATGTIGGTIVAMFWFLGTNSLNPTLLKNLTRSALGNYVGTWTNTQASAYYGLRYESECTTSLCNVMGWGNSHPRSTTGFGIVVTTSTGGANVDSTQLLAIYGYGII